MIAKTTAVPQHSLGELIKALERQQTTAGLYVNEGAGNESNPGTVITYPFRSDHYIIILQLEGSGYSKINFQDCFTRKGDVLTIPANSIRQFFELPVDCCFASVTFTSAYLAQSGLNTKYSDLLDLLSSTQSYVISPEPDDFERLQAILHALKTKYNACNDLPFDQHVLNHLFHAFLFEHNTMYQRCNGSTKLQYTRKEDISMRFVKLLSDTFREERSVIFYAEQLHVTPRYLSQTVKEVTGKSAGELIDELVVMEAKALLNNASLTIAQVADTLYFSDQFFFSKYFKRHTGMSPSEYRKLA